MSQKQFFPAAISKALTAMQEQSDALEVLAIENGIDRKFTLDGRLIGDIGELIAAMNLGISLTKTQKTGYDGIDSKGRQVEIKTTQTNFFAFRKIAQRVICIKLHDTTHYEVIYDGPGKILLPEFTDASFKVLRPTTIGKEHVSLVGQRQISITTLQELS